MFFIKNHQYIVTWLIKHTLCRYVEQIDNHYADMFFIKNHQYIATWLITHTLCRYG